MNVVLPQRINVDQFLAWAEQQSEGRYELVGGKVVMMAPERIRHVRTKARIYSVLAEAVRQAGSDAEVFADGVGVRINNERLREPDVSIQLGGVASPDDLVLDNPVVVVEVLSEGSAAFDKKVNLLYLHSGTLALDEGIHKTAEALYDTLQKSGIKNVVFKDAKGLAHEWQTWRYAFYDFAPRLFQPKK